MNKIIACDIDGCLNRMIYKMIELVKHHYNVDVDDSLTDYEILERLGIKEPKEFGAFWDKHTEELYESEVFPKAAEVLSLFKLNGYKIHIITARGYDIAPMTERWLKENDFVYDDVIFYAGYKADACVWKGAPIMIEDNIKNALALADRGIKVLVPYYKYNEGIHHPNVTYCKDWDEIKDELKRFFNLI